jgi:hypothetical protein
MRNRLAIAVCGLLLLAVNCRHEKAVAEWTIMVYLNGDNSLELYALSDFAEMAKVGSTSDVNIIVQFDRQPVRQPSDSDWSETLRFHVEKDMKPLRSKAYETLGEQDMACGKTVEQFVVAARRRFPARHYAFILWGHGSGYRNLLTALGPYRESFIPGGITPISYKGGTQDNSTIGEKNILYNRELADALGRALGKERLDLFVFDECIMGMIENAYALRTRAHYMVASEELVPETSFDYSDVFGALVRKPSMDAAKLAQTFVQSYGALYEEPIPQITMSAIDLDRIDPARVAVSNLADDLAVDFANQRQAIKSARRESVNYGGECRFSICFQQIDLQRFCELLASNTASTTIRSRANEVIARVKTAVIANAAGKLASRLKGSNGLAIYFPSDGNTYCRDDFNQCGYEKTNHRFPVAFVNDSTWSVFLHRYFQSVPDIENEGTPALADCKGASLGCTPFTSAMTSCLTPDETPLNSWPKLPGRASSARQ